MANSPPRVVAVWSQLSCQHLRCSRGGACSISRPRSSTTCLSTCRHLLSISSTGYGGSHYFVSCSQRFSSASLSLLMNIPKSSLAQWMRGRCPCFLAERSKVLHMSGLPHDTTQSELELVHPVRWSSYCFLDIAYSRSAQAYRNWLCRLFIPRKVCLYILKISFNWASGD